MCKKQYRPIIANTTTFILETCTQTPDTLKQCKDETTQEGYYGNYEAMTIQTDNRKPEKVDRPQNMISLQMMFALLPRLWGTGSI